MDPRLEAARLATADKKPVKNVTCGSAWTRWRSCTDVNWRWVKGHAGDPGNERADALANRGVRARCRRCDLAPVRNVA